MMLERLKELAGKATPGPCVGSGAEILPSGDLRYYIDFPGIKTGSVAGSIALGESINALPALIEVAEAAKEWRDTLSALGKIEGEQAIHDAVGILNEKAKRVNRALIRLEAAHED